MSAKITRIPQYPLDSGGTTPNLGYPYTYGDIVKPPGTPAPGETWTSEDGSVFLGCIVPTALAGAQTVTNLVGGVTAGVGQPVIITPPISAATTPYWPEAVVAAQSPTAGVTTRGGICTRSVTAADVTAGTNLAWIQIAGPALALILLTGLTTTNIFKGSTLKVVAAGVGLVANDAAGTLTNETLAMAVGIDSFLTTTIVSAGGVSTTLTSGMYILGRVMLLNRTFTIA